MKKAEYRNSVRSRRLICDALLELLNEKPFEKITVTDIANRADVNRGTFYLHYDSINAVIDELQDTLIAQMEQYFANLDIPLNLDNIMLLTAECLKFIYDKNQSKYMPLLFNQHISFANKVSKSFQERRLSLNNNDIPKDENNQKELIVRASILAHGIIGAFQASENEILDVSTDQLMQFVDNLVTDMQELQNRKTGTNSLKR